MNSKSIAASLKLGAVAILFFTFLFAGGIGATSLGFIGSAIRELTAVGRDSATQWMLVVCLAIYSVMFAILESPLRRGVSCREFINPNLWLASFVVVALLRYVLTYDTVSRSMQILVLMAGFVFGKAIAAWARPTLLLTILLTLLAVSAWWQPEATRVFQYHGIFRWSGVWDSPNLYGLLMGVGVVLAVGFLGSSIQHRTPNIQCGKKLCMFLCPIAIILCGFGLFKSYSRGAWLAVFAGLIYLAVQAIKCLRFSAWFRHNRLSLTLLAASLSLLAFWEFRFSESRPVQRLFSAANADDFSWRNRVTAWEGAARMMVDKPLAGFGWFQAETDYGKMYCPPRLNNESAAIEMNDYLMIGVSAGAPALFFFAAYILLSFRRKSPSFIIYPPFSILRTARAGSIVLLVGFWFDGGLFKPPVAIVFWTLMELSRILSGGPRRMPPIQETADNDRIGDISSVPKRGPWENRVRWLFCLPSGIFACRRAGASRPAERTVHRGKGSDFVSLFAFGRFFRAAGRTPSTSGGTPDATRLTRGEIALRWMAAILATWALAETAFHLVPPHCLVSERTLSIARRILVQPRERADFETLACQPIWQGQKLKTLLDHVELAVYNRELINWQLDTTNYENYVLSPVITGVSGETFDWRRPLWEEFYPRIRHESSPEEAARIVVRHLRERVTIAGIPDPPRDVPTIWLRQLTDQTGFEIIYVAALRSVGVPARLDANQRAEFWDGSKWSAAPSPAVVSW